MNIQDTLNERQKTHGEFKTNATVAQVLKAIFREQKNWAFLSVIQKEALDFTASKIGRIFSGNADEPDHWKDIAGYNTLVVNNLTTGRSYVNEEVGKNPSK